MSYALRMVGTSMIEHAILPGDYLFVEQASGPQSPGTVVLVIEDGGLACKVVEAGDDVVGRLVGVFRQLEAPKGRKPSPLVRKAADAGYIPDDWLDTPRPEQDT